MSELIRPFRLQRRTVQKPWAGTGLAALFDWARVLPRGTGETIEASSVAGIETPLEGSELTLDSLMNELGQEAML
ncbi:MAG: hypothetical protein KDB07_02535, partial [Planctomycetes bacterium]|nr:hypothetical protein [Planctomycetota bacterium]